MSTSTHPPVTTTPTAQPPAGLPPRKKRRTGWIWLLLALAIGGLAWYLRVPAPVGGTAGGKKGGGKKGFGGADIPVAMAQARRGNVPVYLDGLGTVTAFYTVNVRTRVDGQLMNVAVKEGDFVKEGELIAQVDPRPFEVMLEQSEGTMARDQALLSNAKTDLQRYETLLAQDAIPKQQLDTQRALVAQYEGNTKTDQANINNAKLQLTYARVTAPITGRVGLRLVDPGNIVHAGDTTGLMVITQLQPISVLFTIPEDNLPQVLKKLRAGASLEVDAFNRDKTEKLDVGKLLTVDNTIDATTGTSKLKAVFDNSRNTLFPNQFVNIRLLVDTLRDQVIIPDVAVQQGTNGPFVYVVNPEDGKVRVQQIQVGVVEGNDAQITKGVNPNDTVVTDGADKLQAGQKVRPATLNAAPKGKKKKGGAPAGAATPENPTNQPPNPESSGKNKKGFKGKKEE